MGDADIHIKKMESIPDQLGFLIINEDGAVLDSRGDLINDVNSAKVITRMVKWAWKVKLGDESDRVTRLSLIFSNHMYMATVSKGKIYVVKRPYLS